jgi:hypothetical protein
MSHPVSMLQTDTHLFHLLLNTKCGKDSGHAWKNYFHNKEIAYSIYPREKVNQRKILMFKCSVLLLYNALQSYGTHCAF